MPAATSKVENLAQGSSCQLKFVHASSIFSANEVYINYKHAFVEIKINTVTSGINLFLFVPYEEAR